MGKLAQLLQQDRATTKVYLTVSAMDQYSDRLWIVIQTDSSECQEILEDEGVNLGGFALFNKENLPALKEAIEEAIAPSQLVVRNERKPIDLPFHVSRAS